MFSNFANPPTQLPSWAFRRKNFDTTFLLAFLRPYLQGQTYPARWAKWCITLSFFCRAALGLVLYRIVFCFGALSATLGAEKIANELLGGPRKLARVLV